MEIAEALAYAKRVAMRMTRDPESESIAGIAARRAVQTFDESRGVPIRRWIARCVKTDVWCYWRRIRARRETQEMDAWWNEVYVIEDEPQVDEPPLMQHEWQMMCEYHIDKWTLDVIAKRHNLSMKDTKQLLRRAEAKFLKAVQE